MEDTLAQLQVLDGDQVATACRTTLNILVQNAMENVENKIFEVLDIIAEKVCISCIKEYFSYQSNLSLITYSIRNNHNNLHFTDGSRHTEIFD